MFPTPRSVPNMYASRLVEEGVLSSEEVEGITQEAAGKLQR